MFDNFFLILAVFALTLAAGCKKFEKMPEKSVIRIAGNLPLTGPVAAFCGTYHNAFEMGIEDGCRELGISPGVFEIDFQDNAENQATAASNFQRQALKPIDVYISGTSLSSRAVVSSVDELGVPHFLVSFDAFMPREGENRLRILPGFKLESPLYLDYARRLGAKRIFAFNINATYANQKFSEIIEPRLDEAGVAHKREAYDMQLKDFKTLALKAYEYKPDLIFIDGFSFHIYAILRALRPYGLVEPGKILACIDFVDLLHEDTPREELKNISHVTSLFEISARVEDDPFREKFKEKYAKEPSYVDGYAYDTGRIIAAAYKKFGKVDTKSIFGVLPFDGVTGRIELDEDGDLKTTLAIAQVNDAGEVELVYDPSEK